jgi:DNA-binding MarR family transcriptional regulator
VTRHNIPLDDIPHNEYIAGMTTSRRTQPARAENAEQLAYIELQRAAQACVRTATAALKPFGLTPAQFNVLRILRGAGAPLAASRICERMIHDDPDLTRLLDRLEAAGLVAKARDGRDRRVMNVTITAQGLRTIAKASAAVSGCLTDRFASLGPQRLATLAALLREVRESRPSE